MSKVVSPYPPYEGEVDPAPDAQWWRMQLPQNEDHHYAVTRYEPEQGWMSLEFFDGHNTVIDTGFDKPTEARFHGDNGRGHLDVLHAGPPTPSQLWESLTLPGVFEHPDDANEGS